MLDITEITIDEFKNSIYDKYVKLFSNDEQKEWNMIEETYRKGIEKFYKIIFNNKIVVFFYLKN